MQVAFNKYSFENCNYNPNSNRKTLAPYQNLSNFVTFLRREVFHHLVNHQTKQIGE